jgi:hypothetical protein
MAGIRRVRLVLFPRRQVGGAGGPGPLNGTPACALISGFLTAQGVVGDFLYTTSQNETTASFSGGTVLRHIHPNDIVGMRSCGTFAEKWAPRLCFTTMAGDEDAGDDYWEPGIFGEIDALLASPSSPFGQVNARTVW